MNSAVLSQIDKKPYIPSEQFKKRPERQRMTIAVGFSCKDGIVLGADTLISTQGSYSYENKIFEIGGPKFYCPTAYSGDVSATKTIKDDLERSLQQASDSREDVASLLKVEIARIHKERYSKAPKDEKVWLQLLVAISVKQKWQLWCAQGQDFFRVDKGYQPIGIGSDTGRAIFEPLYRSDMTIQEAKFLAIYGLRLIKSYVPGCGGKSQIYLMEDGWFDFPQEEENTIELESYFDFFEKTTAPLLLSFAAFGSESLAKSFDSRLEAFDRELRKFRTGMEKKAP